MDIKKPKIVEFDKYIVDLANRASTLKHEITKLNGAKDVIQDYSDEQFESRLSLKLSLEGLGMVIPKFLSNLKEVTEITEDVSYSIKA